VIEAIWSRLRPPTWRVFALAVMVVAAMALAGAVFFHQYRPDQQTDDAARQAATQAASDGAVAVLSYSPDTLDHDIANAKSHLTGNFLAYYDKFTQAIMSDAAQQRQVKTTAEVVEAGVSDLHPDSAVVLVFVNKMTSSKQQPIPVPTPATVRVTMTRVNGSWLISEFDPV
jgi:Mce-associated membrane protein